MDTYFSNRYRVLSELGQGAMGKVYRVADSLHGDRVIALKTIHVPGEITPAMRLRFKEEFRVMAQLRHPNTLEVYDFGALDAHDYYFTMELVPGQELADLIAEGPLPLERFYPLVIQLLQALTFIHSRQFVHRDVKAHNVRVREDGTLKLMDFGLACQAGMPAKGQLNGTPGYMAPEMVWGGSIDAASDLYSVGCLAYEMLTGRLPFVGRVAEVLRAHRDERPRSLRELRPEIPERLEKVVLRLLEKDPARRYRHCEHVMRDLAALAGITLTRENLDQRKSYLVSRTLVGREQELAVLTEALKGLREGRTEALFVGAPAGVGKSRLMQEFVLQASLSEVFVLQGSCEEAGHAPYDAIVAALKRLVPYTQADEWARFGPVLATLFPSLVAAGTVAVPAEALPDATQEKLRLHDTVLAWLETTSRRTPLVLFLDDLNFADPQSLELFNHCIRHRRDGRVLYLATFRNDETPSTSPVWFTHDEGLSRNLTLGPLTVDQMGQLLKAMRNDVAVPPAFNQTLYDLTGGNPYFVREVLLFLMEEGLLSYLDGAWRFPQDAATMSAIASVEGTIERRVAHLSPGGRELAQVASVIGRSMDLEMLLAVSGLDEDTLFARLDELIERQFVLKGEHQYAFPHDRTRTTLYESIPEPVRRSLHLRCAAHLEARERNASMSWVFDLAHHYTQGMDSRAAFEYLSLAGDVSDQRNADALALHYWQQAVEALGSLGWEGSADKEFALLLKIGRNGFILSPKEAIEAFERALPMIDTQVADAEEALATRLMVLTLMANAYGFLGAPNKGLEVVERALAACPSEDHAVRAAILTVQATNLMAAGRFDEMTLVAREAAAVLMRDALGDVPPMVLGARVGVAAFQNAVCFQGVRPDEALAAFAYQASAAIGDEHPVTIRQFFGIWYAWTGRYEEAAHYLEEAMAVCRRIGAPPYHWVLYLRPYLLLQRGEHKEALALIDAALLYDHLDQVEMTRLMISVLQGQALLALGHHKTAHMVLTTTLARARTLGTGLVVIQALIALGQVELSLGAPERAERFFREANGLSAQGPTHNPLHQAIAARSLAEAALKAGEPSRARGWLDEALAIVSRPEQDNWVEQGHCHRVWGDVHAATGRRDEAVQALQRAGERYHQAKHPAALHAVIQQLEALRKQPLPSGTEGLSVEARWSFMRGLLH